MKIIDKEKIIGEIVKRIDKKAKIPNSVVEIIIFNMLHFHMSVKSAEKTFHKLKQSFVDWNECRVSSVWEIARCLELADNSLLVSNKIKNLLNNIHKNNYKISLESVLDFPKKQIYKYLKTLGPLDRSTIQLILKIRLQEVVVPLARESERVLVRTGLVPKDSNVSSKQKTLQKLVPEEKAVLFHRSILDLSYCYCLKKIDDVKCSQCPIKRKCNYAGKKHVVTKNL